jgi:hypothetical protein
VARLPWVRVVISEEGGEWVSSDRYQFGHLIV